MYLLAVKSESTVQKHIPVPVPDVGQGTDSIQGQRFILFPRFTPSYINVSKLLCSFSLIQWQLFSLLLKDSSQNKSTYRLSSREGIISFLPLSPSLRHFFSPTHSDRIDMHAFLCKSVIPLRENETQERKKQNQKPSQNLDTGLRTLC